MMDIASRHTGLFNTAFILLYSIVPAAIHATPLKTGPSIEIVSWKPVVCSRPLEQNRVSALFHFYTLPVCFTVDHKPPVHKTCEWRIDDLPLCKEPAVDSVAGSLDALYNQALT